MKLLSAKEARELSNKGLSEQDEKLLEEVATAINEAVEKKEKYFYWYKPMTNGVSKKLEELGYKIEILRDKTGELDYKINF